MHARRAETEWRSLTGVVRVGELEFPCTVTDQPTWDMGGIDTVSVAADAVLLSQVIPYTSTVQLEVLFDDQLEVVFVGPISSVD